MSSSSIVNSFGNPVDQDGEPLEFGIIGNNIAPFAVRGDVFRELFVGSEKSEDAHLETQPLEGAPLKISSSGGIPVAERVDIEDITDVLSDEEPPSPRTAAEMCKNDNSSTIHAILRTSKCEREELYRARLKLGNVLDFLRKKGFSEEQMLAEMSADGMGGLLPSRDENGLPVLSEGTQNPNPFVEKMKSKISDSQPSTDHQVFGDLPPSDNGSPVGVSSSQDIPVAQTPPTVGLNKPSWSSVVRNNVLEEDLVFDYCPMPSGVNVVTPPEEVLKKGLEKFKLCLVGVFSKGTLPFSKLEENARKVWNSKGLCSISQKDSHTFHFKFRSESDMNSVLARGTWYFERKPLILSLWGPNSGENNNSTIPLWVRFKNLPDYYWTREGLSCVASSIGPPICADKMTSQLNPVQFAKLCVRHKVGDPLPEKIKVAVMDMEKLELSTSEFADIEVSYPQRPLICSGCKKLGHMVGACPVVKRVWVQKGVKAPDLVTGNTQTTVEECPVLKPSVPSAPDQEDQVQPKISSVDDSGGEWTTVTNKKHSASSSSAIVGQVPEPLPIFKALSKSMSKGQLKRVRKATGKGSPNKK